MATLIFLKYNNYFNRIMRRENTLEAYRQYRISGENGRLSEFYNVNFNPNDGVETTQDINWFAEQPDYLVVSENGIDISSRWFIIESTRLLNGQHRCNLRRDSIADSWNVLKEAPVYVEKGIVADNDPAIYNKEELVVNQIKKQEILLTDKSECPWIVGYYSRLDSEGNTTNLTGKFYTSGIADHTYNNISNWPYYYTIGQATFSLNRYNKFKWVADASCVVNDYEVYGTFEIDTLNATAEWKVDSTKTNPVFRFTSTSAETATADMNGLIYEAIKSSKDTINTTSYLISDLHSPTDYEDFVSYNNNILKEHFINSCKRLGISHNRLSYQSYDKAFANSNC